MIASSSSSSSRPLMQPTRLAHMPGKENSFQDQTVEWSNATQATLPVLHLG